MSGVRVKNPKTALKTSTGWVMYSTCHPHIPSQARPEKAASASGVDSHTGFHPAISRCVTGRW